MNDALSRLASWPALALLSVCPVAAQDIPLFTRDFPPQEFAARRNAIYDAIGPEAVALVQGAPSPHGNARFRQSNDFYYLCGIEVAHSYLLMDASRRRAILFLPHRNTQREAVEGKALSAEDADQVKELSGIDEVLGTDRLTETLARIVLPRRSASCTRSLARRREQPEVATQSYAPTRMPPRTPGTDVPRVKAASWRCYGSDCRNSSSEICHRRSTACV